jgi:hypothetical protein
MHGAVSKEITEIIWICNVTYLKKPKPFIISAANYQISVIISLISPISVQSIL